MNFFPKNIQSLRKSKSYIQEDLAKLLDVKKNTISNYENGVSEPSFDLLYKIIKIFDISAHDILFTDLVNEEVSNNKKNGRRESVCLRCKDKDQTISALQIAVEALKKMNMSSDPDHKEPLTKHSKKHPYQKTG